MTGYIDGTNAIKSPKGMNEKINKYIKWDKLKPRSIFS